MPPAPSATMICDLAFFLITLALHHAHEHSGSVSKLSKRSPASLSVKSYSCGARSSAHGGNAAIVAVGQFLQRSTLRAASGGLFLLGRGQGRGSPHRLSLVLGAASAFGGAGADQVALNIGKPAEYREH